MPIDIKEILKNLSQAEPSPQLGGFILAAINREREHRNRIRLVWGGVLSLASLGGLTASFIYFVQGFINSGFYSYLSLVFSDFGSTMAYWQDLVLNLAESWPVMETVLILVMILAVLASFRFLTKYYGYKKLHTI